MKKGAPGLSNEKQQDRRTFLLQNLLSLGRLFSDAVSETITTASGGKRYLRPPGAIEEAAFLLTCTRCGDCAKACPGQVIKFLPPTAGAAVGTPYIDPLEAACDLCGKCMPACEPKALLVVEDPRKVKMGTAVINPDTCWAYEGQVCDLCYQRCPFPDEAIRMVAGKPEIFVDACTGCGLCAYVCVSTPISIKIEPRG
jgi:ferredoxin-type protein NapG